MKSTPLETEYLLSFRLLFLFYVLMLKKTPAFGNYCSSTKNSAVHKPLFHILFYVSLLFAYSNKCDSLKREKKGCLCFSIKGSRRYSVIELRKCAFFSQRTKPKGVYGLTGWNRSKKEGKNKMCVTKMK